MDSPQYLGEDFEKEMKKAKVLNLIINGQSSIHQQHVALFNDLSSFKPYYKWIVLNTRNRIN